MKNIVLKVDNISMKFNLMEKKVDNLKEFVIKMIKNELRYQEFWALHDISFSLAKGDRLGILGFNGAGKSTLLKIIAGVLKATEGKVTMKGKIVPLLELGAGFDPQYTGAENIYLYGALLGYPKDFIKEKYDEIVEFSELGDFIHVPVKNYSSGMKARLGFSIATIVEPDILILDEVLSVGDAKFRKKSEKRIQAMFDSGVTVLFVSHSLEQVKRICNRAIILEQGRLIAEGPVEDVSMIYETMVGDIEEVKVKKKKKKKKKKKAAPVEETNTAVSSEEEKQQENSDDNIQTKTPQNSDDNIQTKTPQNSDDNIQTKTPQNSDDNIETNIPQNSDGNTQINMTLENSEDNIETKISQNSDGNIQTTENEQE